MYSEPVAGVGTDESDTHSNDHQGDSYEGKEGGAVPPNKDMIKIFDIANDDKYLNTLVSKQVIKRVLANESMQCEVSKKWRQQTDFDFRVVPLSDFLLSDSKDYGRWFESPIDQHYEVRRHGVPNFWGARSPVSSQLNVEEWQNMLEGYLGCSAVGSHTFWLSFRL